MLYFADEDTPRPVFLAAQRMQMDKMQRRMQSGISGQNNNRERKYISIF